MIPDLNADERFDVAVGGHGYMVDTKYIDDFGRQSISAIRQQSDSSDRPGEGSLNPAGPWRRSQESWHLGAGQTWLDRTGSDPFRFSTSKGVDVWTRWQLSRLPATSQARTSVNTNLYAVTSGGRLYMADGQQIYATGVGTSVFAACTGTPAATVTSLTSDGTTVYAGYGASGVYTATGTVFASVYTGTADMVRYLLGRLIVSSGKAVYNVTAAGPITGGTVLLDHPNTGWAWTDAGEGAGHIYLSGYAGDKSMIYRTQIKEDATGLAAAVPAGPLPDGELARSLTGYLGYVVVGTDKGARFTVADTDGNLTLGALIPTSQPVLCAEPQGRFVWFGLTNFDASSTGLGRMDLENFTADLTPAYASDLLALSLQGAVQAVVTYAGKRWFTVSGDAIWVESTSVVPSATMTFSKATFGLPDDKTFTSVKVSTASAVGTSTIQVEDVDSGTDLGTQTVSGYNYVFTNNLPVAVRWVSLRMTLAGSTQFTVYRATMYAEPNPDRTLVFQVPLRLFPTIELVGGVAANVDVQAEMTFLRGLFTSGELVYYQEANDQWRVKVDDVTWRPDKRGPDHWSGTALLRLKEV